MPSSFSSGDECPNQQDHARWFKRRYVGGIGQRSVTNKYSTRNPLNYPRPTPHHGLLVPASRRSVSLVQLNYSRKKNRLTPPRTCTQPQTPSLRTRQKQGIRQARTKDPGVYIQLTSRKACLPLLLSSSSLGRSQTIKSGG